MSEITNGAEAADKIEKQKELERLEAEADRVAAADKAAREAELIKNRQEDAESDKTEYLGPKRWNIWGKNK